MCTSWRSQPFGIVICFGIEGYFTVLSHRNIIVIVESTDNARLVEGLPDVSALVEGRVTTGRMPESRGQVIAIQGAGKPAGDVPALVEAILAVARYAAAHLDSLAELDVNPIIVRPSGHGVVAVDALVRIGERA